MPALLTEKKSGSLVDEEVVWSIYVTLCMTQPSEGAANQKKPSIPPSQTESPSSVWAQTATLTNDPLGMARAYIEAGMLTSLTYSTYDTLHIC